MSTATVAIIVSVISTGIALFSLGWNIYRDIVLKPRLKITFGVRELVTPGSNEKPEFVYISATNFGPGSTTATMVHTRKTSF